MQRAVMVIVILGSLILLPSCSGGKGGNGLTSFFSDENSPSDPIVTPEVLPEVLEVAKLQTAIQAEPEYKIDESEIETMKIEGIITDDDVAKIQTIQ